MERGEVTCGVDIGSTNTKVLLVARSGSVVSSAAHATPRQADGGTVDATELVDLVEGLIVEAAGERWKVAAVCAAGVGEDGVFVNGHGVPLGPALAWFDPRRTRVVEDLDRAAFDRHEAGISLDAARSAVGWALARSLDPAGLDDARAWTALTDFAAARWTSQAFMSDTLAARTAAWDPWSRTWLAAPVAATLRDPNLLPQVVATGSVVGVLRSPTLAAAGVVSSGAVVVAGGHDHPIGGWAVDQAFAPAVLDSMGTAEVVVAQTSTVLDRSVADVDISPGILQPRQTVLKVAELARNVTWASHDEPSVGSAIDAIIRGALMPSSPVREDLFVPGDVGGGSPRWTPLAAGLSPVTLATAVLAGCVAEGEACVDRVTAHAQPDAVTYAAGGWARSEGWMRLKRVRGGRPLAVVPNSEVTGVGAALLAGLAIDWNQDALVALGPQQADVLA